MNSSTVKSSPFSAITVLVVFAILAYALVLWQGSIQKSLEETPVACTTGSPSACQVGTYCKAALVTAPQQTSGILPGEPAPVAGTCTPLVYRILDAVKFAPDQGR